MNFTVPVQAVLAPIMQVCSICNSAGVNNEDLTPFMYMEVAPGNLTLLGTDGNVQLKAQVPLPEDACESGGSLLISATKARDFFRTLGESEDVSIRLNEEEENVEITSAKGNYKIRVRSLGSDKSFPVFDVADDMASATAVQIPERKLKYMLDKSLFCVCHENFREYLKGVRFEIKNDDFAIFTLDGHRMAVLETKLDTACSGEVSASLTLRGASELGKLISDNPDRVANMEFSQNFAIAHLGMYTLTSRLLKCNYPNVRAVLPKDLQTEVNVELDSLKRYVKRLSGFTNKRLNNINFTFSPGKLTLFAQNLEREIGSAELISDYTVPNERQINLNADFMKDFLNAIDSPSVVFGFAPPYSNTQLRPNIENEELGIKVRYVVSHIVV